MRPRATRLVPLCAAVLLLSQFDAALACTTRQQGYRTAMLSDLFSLVNAEADFHERYGHYTADLDSLAFSVSTGVNPPSIQIVGAAGWRARNTHPQVSFFCTVAIGEAIQPNERAGELHCADLHPQSRLSAVLTGLAKQIFLPSTFLGFAALVVLIRLRMWTQRSPKFAAVRPVVFPVAVASIVLLCLRLAVVATGGTIGGTCDLDIWDTQPFAIFLPFFCGAIAFVVVGVFRHVRGTGAHA